MPAFLTLIFLGYVEASWRCSLGFILFSYSRSRVCLNSDTISEIRRQHLPRWGELPRCESMCERTAHLYFTKSVGGHTQRAAHTPGANLLPALHGGSHLTLPSCTGLLLHGATPATPSGQSHQRWLCTSLSSQASVQGKAQKCLPGHLLRSRTEAVCRDLTSEALEKCGTFCRSTYTARKCFKNCTWVCLSPQFPCRQVLCEISGAALGYLHAYWRG